MAEQSSDMAQLADFAPAVPHLIIDPHGHHALAGTHCSACGATVEGDRFACQACGERKAIERVRLGTRGVIYAHTVVHRSFPGVKTPFVSVVVDLEGGASVRGSLVDVDPLGELPEKVAMVFRDTGQKDKSGRPFLSYFFVPEGLAA